MKDAVQKALETLTGLLNEDDRSIRLAAAQMILRYAVENPKKK